MNDDFKFSKENLSFLIAVACLIYKFSFTKKIWIVSFTKRGHGERTSACFKNVHFIHDCCPLQQVAMAEKVSPCSIEV